MVLSISSKKQNCFGVKGTELFVNLYCKQSYLAIRKDESPRMKVQRENYVKNILNAKNKGR